MGQGPRKDCQRETLIKQMGDKVGSRRKVGGKRRETDKGETKGRNRYRDRRKGGDTERPKTTKKKKTQAQIHRGRYTATRDRTQGHGEKSRGTHRESARSNLMRNPQDGSVVEKATSKE